MAVNVGDQAPEFTLSGTGKQEIALGRYRGNRNVLLAFYPLDWSPG
jgi:peroxiredoxin